MFRSTATIRRFWLLGLFCLCEFSVASVSVSFDILDSTDPGGSPPPGMLIVDVSVDVADLDTYTGLGISGSTFNAAVIVYGANDPNWPGVPTVLPPQDGDRFVTFGSFAYARDELARYAPAGTTNEPTIGTTGGYDPPNTGQLEPNRVNITCLTTTFSPTALRGRDGYVFRLALNVSGVQLPGAGDASNFRIFDVTSVPAGFFPVFESNADAPAYGTLVSTWQSELEGRSWGVYVPEPSTSLLFLVLFATWSLRRT